MTGRLPACEDVAAIAERLREIQTERMARIAGCPCEQHDMSGNLLHAPGCPLRPPPQAALALAVAMERLRARHKRRPMTADEIYAEGVAAKYARHRVLT